MANRKRIKLLEQLRKVGMEEGADFLREGLKVMAEAFMEVALEAIAFNECYWITNLEAHLRKQSELHSRMVVPHNSLPALLRTHLVLAL
ncbi:hypothetical protein ACFLYR_07245 [Chloroflexota bacterium]